MKYHCNLIIRYYTIASGYLDSLGGAGQTIILQAENNITINQLVVNPLDWTTAPAIGSTNLVFQAGNHITFSAAGPFTVNTNNTNGGYIHLEADSPHAGVGGPDQNGNVGFGRVSLVTGGGDVTLISSAVGIFSFALGIASIDAVTGDVYIGPSTDGVVTMILGSGFTSILSNTELDHITTTGTVTIGQATTAGSDGQGTGALSRTALSITIDAVGPANFNDLVLVVANSVNDLGAGTAITVPNLTLNAGGTIGTGAANPLTIDVNTLNADTSAANGQIDIDLFNNTSIGLIQSGSGNITLQAWDGANYYDIDSNVLDGAPDINTSGTLNLLAHNIGFTSPLEIVAGTLNADTSASNGFIEIMFFSNITLGTVNAGPAGTVWIWDFLGGGFSISDDADAGAVDIFANWIDLVTGTGIGTVTDPIETQATLIAAYNGNSGDIAISNTDAGTGTTNIIQEIIIPSGGLWNADTGNTDAGGSIVFTNTGGALVVNAFGAIQNNDAGPITITNTDPTNTGITVNAPVTITTNTGLSVTGTENIITTFLLR